MKFIILFCLFSTVLEAKLLDKISGIVDDNVITLSQISRTQKSLLVRKSIAPMIYNKSNFTDLEILNILVDKFLIRAKLTELGYAITDDQVESQIKANEKRLNVDRTALMKFLSEQNSTFSEYFETLREAIEYSYFTNRVISPLISVSDQDVKNYYFKQNSKDTRLNFKYTLIDYTISKSIIPHLEKGQLENIIKQYRNNNNLPEKFSSLTSTNLDDIGEEGLAAELKLLLKKTDEGSLTSPIDIDGNHHIFYLSKKDLVESEAFVKSKDRIREELVDIATKIESETWLDREKNKHYIKISL
jgi:peptidyl-prolyl cis-trans isomerase SurA